MAVGPFIAEAASLIGDPARANMLAALMDGRAFTATELAHIAGVSPQTTSGHLAKLLQAKLISVERQGRHRYFKLANRHVAEALEALMVLAVNTTPRYRPTGPKDEAMRFARTCYDHLAGRLGVSLTWRFVDLGYLEHSEESFELTAEGEIALINLGVDVATLRQRKRALTRRCLDWSERRPHLGGALGAAILVRLAELGWITKARGSRAVALTETGRDGLAAAFSLADP